MTGMDPIIIQVGPDAREPSDEMRKFMGRDEFPSLLAYWLWWEMSKIQWRALVEQAIEESIKAGNPRVWFWVSGLGVIGGITRYEETR